MDMMDEPERTCQFSPVLGMPTSVLKYGRITSQTEALFLVIPGNPGVIEYYDCFMSHLFIKCDKKFPVWGVSHAGHVQPPGGNQDLYKILSYDLCTLQGQIRHKVAFIQDNIPGHVKLFLIGHSIGCYIILKILDQLEHPLQRCFMLFPTIERMAVSPNGRKFTPALKYFRWLAPPAAYSISVLPASVKNWLVQRFFQGDSVPPCVYSATLSLVNPFSVGNSLYMAHQEMQMVDKLDSALIARHQNCLSFYFGNCDKWCPLHYSEDFKKQFPNCDVRICEKGYKHAYVIEESLDLAEIVGEWVQKFL